MSTIVPWTDFKTILTNANLGYPIKMPNEPWEEPQAADAVYIDISALDADTTHAELSDKLWFETGMIGVNVMIRVGNGIDEGLTLLWTISKLYRHLGARKVVYLDRSTGLMGSDQQVTDGGNWYSVGITIQYRFQDEATS